MEKMTVERFCNEICACLDKEGKPSKFKMLSYISAHAVFYVKNFPLIEGEINRRMEIERLSLDCGSSENVE